MEWQKDPNKDREKRCNCCIEIEESIVVIICGEFDIDRLKDSLKAVVEVKGNAKGGIRE
jgi:hypothetical protein